MKIAAIAALTKNRVIGKSNKLLWHIPEDLKQFKQLTSQNTIIMGKKTYDSIGRPLPNRNNIVLSRSMKPHDGIIIARTPEEALEKAKSLQKDIFIIGGEQIYTIFLKDCGTLYLSYVKGEYEGDACFPQINEKEWKVTKRTQYEQFELVVYKKKE